MYEFMDDGGLLLIGVAPKYIEMLRRLPAIAHGDGAERFREPDPMDPQNRSPEARSLRDDWMDLVVPELHEIFDNQHCAVNEVLDKAEPSYFDDWLFHQQKLAKDFAENFDEEMEGDDEDAQPPERTEAVDLIIPPELIEPWYGALNQGRLALHARYGDSEGEFTNSEDSSKSDAWNQARAHYSFYSFLQYPLIHLMQTEFDEKFLGSDESQAEDDDSDDDLPF